MVPGKLKSGPEIRTAMVCFDPAQGRGLAWLDDEQPVVGDVVFPCESVGEFGEVDTVFLNDSGHEFIEGLWIATFGGVEQVDGVFDGQLGNFFAGVLQCGEWSCDGVGDGASGVDHGLACCGVEGLHGRAGGSCGSGFGRWGFRRGLGRVKAAGKEAGAEYGEAAKGSCHD